MKKQISNDTRYAFVNQRAEFAGKLFESFRAETKLVVYPENFQENYSEILNFRKLMRARKLLELEKVKHATGCAIEFKLKVEIILTTLKDKYETLSESEKQVYDTTANGQPLAIQSADEAEVLYKTALIDAELFFRSECKAAKRNHHEHFTKKICNRLRQLKEA